MHSIRIPYPSPEERLDYSRSIKIFVKYPGGNLNQSEPAPKKENLEPARQDIFVQTLLLASATVILSAPFLMGYILYLKKHGSSPPGQQSIARVDNPASVNVAVIKSPAEDVKISSLPNQLQSAPTQAHAEVVAAENWAAPPKANSQKQAVVSRDITYSGANRLNEPAHALVKIYCSGDAESEEIKQGSGVLFRSAASDSQNYPFYIQTNLHLLKTSDGSLPRCEALIYPDSADEEKYFSFGIESYKFYRDDLDIALLKPKVMPSGGHAGTAQDLAAHAIDRTNYGACDSMKIGDRLFVLGYPSTGGQTITVTDGIVSGFELDRSNTRFVKTSAKIDYGTSGGIAVKDSGCIVGIPTFVQKGDLESIGRVLDLNYLYNITLATDKAQ